MTDDELTDQIAAAVSQKFKNLPQLQVPFEYFEPCLTCEQKGVVISRVGGRYNTEFYIMDTKLVTCHYCCGLGWVKRNDTLKKIR